MPLFIYLSPHFDDAALSCGGLLRANAERGERAVVLTVCAGTPDYGNLSKFAEVQHRQWGRQDDPIATRRAEDEEAARRLGVTTHYLDIPDCIYRRDARGRPVVRSNRSLFGRVHPDEQPLVQRIAQELLARVRRRSDTRILAPLAAGRHVDHQLVRDAARLLSGLGYNVAWYEDFPYAAVRGAVTRARSAFDGSAWECAVFPIDVERKIDAIRAYQSQLKSTFRSERDMAARVRAYQSQLKSTFRSERDMAARVRAYNRAVAGGQDDSSVPHRSARDLRPRAGGQGYAERIWHLKDRGTEQHV